MIMMPIGLPFLDPKKLKQNQMSEDLEPIEDIQMRLALENPQEANKMQFLPEGFEPETAFKSDQGPELDDLFQEGPQMAAFKKHQQEMPDLEDFRPNLGRKLLAALIGGGTGFTSGAQAGMKAADEINNQPYQKAFSRWKTRGTGIESLAKLEEKDQDNKRQLFDVKRQMKRDERADELGNERLEHQRTKSELDRLSREKMEGERNIDRDLARQGIQEQRRISNQLAKDKLSEPDNKRIDRAVSQFDSHEIVKRHNKLKEGYNFVKKLNDNTLNSADDQMLISAFAKAMDPDSVVREGEYNTVQKYAQAWAESLGFDAKRVFSNGPFLTPEARKNMKKSIEAKYNASREGYKNLKNQFSERVTRMGGKPESLTQYDDEDDDDEINDIVDRYMRESK